MARWIVVVSVAALVIALACILSISNPPRAVGAVAVADEIASEISTLTDWPPYSALRRVPTSLRRSWRNRLTVLVRETPDEREWVLAAVLLEVLTEADEFDRCDLEADLDSFSRCYEAWLRYHLGWDVGPRDVYRLAAEAADGLLEAVNSSQSDVMRPWLSVEADRLVEVLTAALQQANDEIRIATDSLIPFGSVHDCVSVNAAAGPPVAGYWGVDPAGCPIVRLDTAAARLWGPEEVRRISAHEVWPGHHLLAVLAAEPLHPILRAVDWLGFTEGWATYAEAMASSIGPDGRLPRAMDLHLLRLALLARVDVGVHALGWPAERAADTLDFRGGYTAKEAEATVAGILMTPGKQASYFLGYLTFRLLRDAANHGRSDSIRSRRFHDIILRHGPLPLGTARELLLEGEAREGPPRPGPTPSLFPDPPTS